MQAAVRENTGAVPERAAPRAASERAGSGLTAGTRSEPIARAVTPAAPLRSIEASSLPSAPKDSDEDGLDEAAAKGVSLALGQAGKERQSAATKPRVAKRAPPAPPSRRTRATAAPKPAPAAPSAAAANNKLDCKQPFWIDEKGIRRLKMACL